MFTESSLRKIKDFSAQVPIVSLYLNTDPGGGNAEINRLKLRNMIKDISLKQDVEAIEKFFNYVYDWSTFDCAPAWGAG